MNQLKAVDKYSDILSSKYFNICIMHMWCKIKTLAPLIMASNLILTEDPAQNGQEFLIGGELLRDRAPKESATMEQPRTSCSKPRESRGRAGSSAGMIRVCDPDIRDGRADTQRLRLL